MSQWVTPRCCDQNEFWKWSNLKFVSKPSCLRILIKSNFKKIVDCEWYSWINDLDSYDFLCYSHGIFLLLCSKKDHWAPVITGHRHIEMTKGQSLSTRPDLQMERWLRPWLCWVIGLYSVSKHLYTRHFCTVQLVKAH